MTVTADENMRMFNEDMGRLFMFDRPSRCRAARTCVHESCHVSSSRDGRNSMTPIARMPNNKEARRNASGFFFAASVGRLLDVFCPRPTRELAAGDQGLVHDGAEVGGCGCMPGLLNRLGNLGD